MGLLGSAAFMENPPVPREKIVAMINFDMIGRLNRKTLAISIGGTGTSAESQAILDSLLASIPLKATYSPEGFGPSDHASFYAKNIPVFISILVYIPITIPHSTGRKKLTTAVW